MTSVAETRDGSVESVSWHVRLSDSEPHKRYIVLAAASLVGLLGIFVLQRPLMGMLGFAIILASTAEAWLGVKFTVDSTGARRRCGLSVSEMRWEDVKRVIVEGNLVKLSPLEKANRLDPFRGVILETTPDTHERVLDAIRTHCGEIWTSGAKI
jgi:hypothetical protein